MKPANQEARGNGEKPCQGYECTRCTKQMRAEPAGDAVFHSFSTSVILNLTIVGLILDITLRKPAERLCHEITE